MDLERGEQVQLQILIITKQFQAIMRKMKVSLTIASKMLSAKQDKQVTQVCE